MQLHQQKGMISLSPPTICNSAVHRNTAYQALKDACDDLFARQFSYQSLSEKVTLLITNQDG